MITALVLWILILVSGFAGKDIRIHKSTRKAQKKRTKGMIAD
jgi:hypothetical protein